MLTTAAPVGVGSRRSERRAARVTGVAGGVGVGARAYSFDETGGET